MFAEVDLSHRKGKGSTGLLGPDSGAGDEPETTEVCLFRAVLAGGSPRGWGTCAQKQSGEHLDATLGKRGGDRPEAARATHIGVGVLRLCFGQRGVTVGTVVFTEVIGSLRVGGDQQLLDVSLWADGSPDP